MSSSVVSTLTSYIEISSSDSGDYDDGIPKINKLNFGYYNVPTFEDFNGYMFSVDNELIGGPHKELYPSAYISSEQYISNYNIITDNYGNTLSILNEISTINDTYAPVNSYCTQAPYVDRMAWIIDENQSFTFLTEH